MCMAIAVIACGNGVPGGSTGPSTGKCNGTAAASSLGTATMTIDATDGLVFSPASSTAQVGEVVEFKNTGSVEHNVTFQDNNDSCLTDATLDPGASWQVKFTSAGDVQLSVHNPRAEHEGRDHGVGIGCPSIEQWLGVARRVAQPVSPPARRRPPPRRRSPGTRAVSGEI